MVKEKKTRKHLLRSKSRKKKKAILQFKIIKVKKQKETIRLSTVFRMSRLWKTRKEMMFMEKLFQANKAAMSLKTHQMKVKICNKIMMIQM